MCMCIFIYRVFIFIYSDIKVSTIKDLLYANYMLILLDASKIKCVDEKV